MILIIFCKAIGHLWLPRRVYVLSGLKAMWAFFRSHSLWHFDPTQHVLTLPEVFARKFASIVVLFEVVGVLAPEPRAVFESLWFICCLPCAAIFFLLKCQRAPQSIANHWWLPAFLRPDVRWKRMARRQPCSSARTEKGQTWQINSQQYASNKEQSLLRCELSSQYISIYFECSSAWRSWGFMDSRVPGCLYGVEASRNYCLYLCGTFCCDGSALCHWQCWLPWRNALVLDHYRWLGPTTRMQCSLCVHEDSVFPFTKR